MKWLLMFSIAASPASVSGTSPVSGPEECAARIATEIRQLVLSGNTVRGVSFMCLPDLGGK